MNLPRMRAMRRMPASGSRSRPSSTGESLEPIAGVTARAVAVWMVSVTVCAPLLTPMLLGEKVAVAPGGRPAVVKAITPDNWKGSARARSGGCTARNCQAPHWALEWPR